MTRQRGVQSAVKGRRLKAKKSAKIDGAVVGLLVGLDQSGVPFVDYSGNPDNALTARATMALSERQVGQQVVLVFEGGNPLRPIVVGLLHDPKSAPAAKIIQAKVDGETITLTAEKEMVLKCGKAIIQLTEDGKITVRGTYLLSRSSGVNRIQGGSIQLN